MKILPEHYAFILEKFREYIAKNPELVKAHREKLKNYRGDADKRMRWDLSFVAIDSQWYCDNIYVYANDDHLDTAFRKIQSELNF